MKIILTSQTYLKLKYYVLGCDDEISGIGQSQYVNQDTIKITDIVIFKQDVSGGSTDLNKDEMANFLSEKLKRDGDASDWNVWWHSHASMGTFWSGTDDDTIKSFLSDGYIIALETNHKLDFIARIDVFKPFKHTIEDIDVEIDIEEDPRLYDKITKEIKEKVSKCFGYKWNDEEEPEEKDKKNKKGKHANQITMIEDDSEIDDDNEFEELDDRLDTLTESEMDRYAVLYRKIFGYDYDHIEYPYKFRKVVRGQATRRKKIKV